YYAAGTSFRNALGNVLAIAAKREPEYVDAVLNSLRAQVELAQEEKRKLPDYVRVKMENPGKWNYLRFDVVQATLPVKNFVIASNMLLLGSVTGIAFDQVATFAFTPEQLIGRCLLTGRQQLSIPAVANLIAESNNWAAFRLWSQMGGEAGGFNVTLFECDSYMADASGAKRLFRGRPVKYGYAGENPDAATEAREVAGKIAAVINAKGRLQVPFAEWVHERLDGRIALRDRSEAIIALCRTAQLPGISLGERQLCLDTALKLVQPLIGEVKRYDANEKRSAARPDQPRRRPAAQRTYACAVENENLDPEAMEVPKRLAVLQDTAAAYLAFAEIVKNNSGSNPQAARCRQTLPQMYRHIMVNISQGGKFNNALLYPEMTVMLESVPSRLAEADTIGLVGLAMQAHLELFPEEKGLAQLIEAWRKDALAACFGEAVPADEWPHSPWLAEFLASGGDKASMAALMRMALAAVGGVEKAPPLPDMYGAPADIPSMTWAAVRLRVAMLAEKCFRANGLTGEADAVSSSAWPLWIFSRQARMEACAASIL
ncbi:MAG: hypothetical protein J6S21_04980, partial [Victivallales bacterium]|nr:hypothetical protein [Victivallales bacterium]